MKPSIVNALRKATGTVLKIDSYTIVLTPHERVAKPGGEFALVAKPDRLPQKFNIEPVADSGVPAQSEGAQVHTWTYELVGKYNSHIAIGDTWQLNGTTYEVTALKPFNGYERRAVVRAIGKDPAYGT